MPKRARAARETIATIRRMIVLGTEWARRPQNARALERLAEDYLLRPGDYRPINTMPPGPHYYLYCALFLPPVAEIDSVHTPMDRWTLEQAHDFWPRLAEPLRNDPERNARLADAFIRAVLLQWEERKMKAIRQRRREHDATPRQPAHAASRRGAVVGKE
jgi:hypothetical protein